MRLLTALLLLLWWGLAPAAVTVDGCRASGDGGAVELALSGEAKYSHFTLANPPRVVIDLRETRLAARLPRDGVAGTAVTGVRSAERGDGRDLRVVFDLKQAVTPKVRLVADGGRQRLLVELGGNGGGAPAKREAKAKAEPRIKPAAKPVAKAARPAEAEKVTEKSAPRPAPPAQKMARGGRLRDVVIAIDPGHGGKDTGAIGPNGVAEKDAVLAIGLKLASLIKRERGMKAVMTRSGDEFLRLRQRMNKARAAQADLFISIHANSYPEDKRVKGAAVYVVSDRGATNEAARWLAEKENASDLIGGVSLDDKDDQLGAVLLDLAQTATLEDSMEAAGAVLGQLRQVGKVHKGRVERAGFVVLKSPDMPSMLVETAFITNPTEERELADDRHQWQVASALLAGVRHYFARKAPPGTLLAAAGSQRDL